MALPSGAQPIERFYPYAAGPGNLVSAGDWSTLFQHQDAHGVVTGFAVTATGTGLSVQVATGSAVAGGVWAEASTAHTLTASANTSGQPRLDRVMLTWDWVESTTYLEIVTGTPGNTTPPAPTQTLGTKWQLPLATLRIASGQTVLGAGDITDERLAWGAPTATLLPAVAAAATITPPGVAYAHRPRCYVLPVTGTGTITSVATGGVPDGTVLGLWCQDGAFVEEGAAGTLRLAGAFRPPPDRRGHLWLRYDAAGPRWVEMARTGERVCAAQATRTTDQVIAAGSPVAVTWDASVLRHAEWPFWSALPTTALQVPTTGVYVIQVTLRVSLEGTLGASLRKNGTTTLAATEPGFSSGSAPAQWLGLNAVARLNAGDTLDVVLEHNGPQAATLYVVSGSAPLISVVRQGAVW